MNTLMRINYNNQYILDPQDIITGWLSGSNPTSVIVDDIEPINIYNNWCKLYDNAHTITAVEENKSDNFVEQCLQNWNMPDEYNTYPIWDYCIKQCDTIEKQQRVSMEFDLYNERGMLPVLRFLKYLVDVCNKNNIVLGVGRGSSVASYVLYLLGVHKIDSLKYELDIKEFLK
jgi:DNA polymerase III alpha subunit